MRHKAPHIIAVFKPHPWFLAEAYAGWCSGHNDGNYPQAVCQTEMCEAADLAEGNPPGHGGKTHLFTCNILHHLFVRGSSHNIDHLRV